jgi:RNA-directed DNA polymerase
MNKHTSKHRLLSAIKIHTTQELSLRLGVDLHTLEKIASDVSSHCHKKIEIDRKGKEREVYPPNRKLRGIQKAIQKELLDRISYPPTFHGGLKEHSTKTNAEPHVAKRLVAEYDIKSFFPNVSSKSIYEMFVNQGCTPHVARMLTQLTTVDGHMVQGFLTSPKLSVLVLLQIDKRLTKLFKKHGLVHTVWIDNLTVSGSFRIQNLERLIRQIFFDDGFILKEPLYTYNNERQLVTGATVNDKVMPPKGITRSLRKTQFLMEKYGVESYLQRYYPNTSVGRFKILIIGQLSYLLSLNREKYLPMHQWFGEYFKKSEIT